MADLSFIFLIYINDLSDELTTNVKLYLLKVNNRNTSSSVSIVNFEHAIAGWVTFFCNS